MTPPSQNEPHPKSIQCWKGTNTESNIVDQMFLPRLLYVILQTRKENKNGGEREGGERGQGKKASQHCLDFFLTMFWVTAQPKSFISKILL